MTDHALTLLLVFAGPIVGFVLGRLSRPTRRRRWRLPEIDRQTITPAEAHTLDVECCRRALRAGYDPKRRLFSGGHQPNPGVGDPSGPPPTTGSGAKPPKPVNIGGGSIARPPPRRVEVAILRKPPPSSDD